MQFESVTIEICSNIPFSPHPVPKTTLIQEVDHRAKNTIQIAANLLSVPRTASSAEVRIAPAGGLSTFARAGTIA